MKPKLKWTPNMKRVRLAYDAQAGSKLLRVWAFPWGGHDQWSSIAPSYVSGRLNHDRLFDSLDAACCDAEARALAGARATIAALTGETT